MRSADTHGTIIGPRDRCPSVAKEPIPDSVKSPLSLGADYADPYLYGGVAAIVGILGLLVGGGLLVAGNLVSGGVLLGLGVVLFVAGFLMARRGR